MPLVYMEKSKSLKLFARAQKPRGFESKKTWLAKRLWFATGGFAISNLRIEEYARAL